MCAPKEPSRRARSDSCSVRTLIRRLQYWNDEVSDVKTGEIYVYRKGSITSNISTERAFRRGRTLGLAAPSHTVPYGTVLSRYASQALRARLRSYCPSGTKYILRAEGRCPRHFVPGYGRVGPPGRSQQALAIASERGLNSSFWNGVEHV
jgi:hypothetical protein